MEERRTPGNAPILGHYCTAMENKEVVYLRDEDKIQMLMRIDVGRQIVMSPKKAGCPHKERSPAMLRSPDPTMSQHSQRCSDYKRTSTNGQLISGDGRKQMMMSPRNSDQLCLRPDHLMSQK